MFIVNITIDIFLNVYVVILLMSILRDNLGWPFFISERDYVDDRPIRFVQLIRQDRATKRGTNCLLQDHFP